MVLLNVLLVVAAAWLVWLVRKNWGDAAAKQEQFLTQPGKAPKGPQSAGTPGAPRASAGDYFDVAQKTLFSKDRNPNVVVEPPPPAPPAPAPKPIPPLPVYYGQMSLGEPVIVLASERTEQKSYHKGDTIGNFKLVSFDRDKIKLEFDGNEIEHELTELAPKAGTPPPQQAVVAAAPPPSAGVTTLGWWREGRGPGQSSDRRGYGGRISRLRLGR